MLQKHCCVDLGVNKTIQITACPQISTKIERDIHANAANDLTETEKPYKSELRIRKFYPQSQSALNPMKSNLIITDTPNQSQKMNPVLVHTNKIPQFTILNIQKCNTKSTAESNTNKWITDNRTNNEKPQISNEMKKKLDEPTEMKKYILIKPKLSSKIKGNTYEEIIEGATKICNELQKITDEPTVIKENHPPYLPSNTIKSSTSKEIIEDLTETDTPKISDGFKKTTESTQMELGSPDTFTYQWKASLPHSHFTQSPRLKRSRLNTNGCSIDTEDNQIETTTDNFSDEFDKTSEQTETQINNRLKEVRKEMLKRRLPPQFLFGLKSPHIGLTDSDWSKINNEVTDEYMVELGSRRECYESSLDNQTNFDKSKINDDLKKVCDERIERNKVFSAFICSELNEIKNHFILHQLKWEIQQSVQDALRKQMVENRERTFLSKPERIDTSHDARKGIFSNPVSK